MGLRSSKPKNPPPQFTGTSVSPQNVNGMVEVFHTAPTFGKCYFTAQYEKGVGRRYFVSRENLRYVGEYIRFRNDYHGGVFHSFKGSDDKVTTIRVDEDSNAYWRFIEDPSCSGDVSKLPVMTAPIGGKRKKTKKKVRRYKH